MPDNDTNDAETPPKVIKTNYASNSNKSKEARARAEEEPEKKTERVIEGGATQKKKSIGRKIRETFTGDDMHSVGNFIMFDIFLPAIKQMLSDAVSQGVDRTLFGDSGRSGARRGSMAGQNRNYISYNRYSTPSATGRAGEPDGPRAISQRARAIHDFDEIVLETRADAEQVLDALQAIIDQYKVATVSDLYDSVGITGNFTDQKWGWNDIRNARVVRDRSGYVLNLPRPIAVD